MVLGIHWPKPRVGAKRLITEKLFVCIKHNYAHEPYNYTEMGAYSGEYGIQTCSVQ